jgi:hypothetical protein
LRIGLLLESDRQIAAFEALIDALCGRGHGVHLAVMGETVKDREGALARLSAAHLGLSVGHAPGRQDRYSSLLRDLLDRFEPLAAAGEDEEDEDTGPPAGRPPLGALALAAIPEQPDIAAYIRQLDLDLMLFSPRADPWSARLDYLITCRRAGVPMAQLARSETEAASLPGIALIAAEPELAIAQAERAGAPARPRARIGALSPALETVLAMRGLRRFAEERLGADVRHGIALGLLQRGVGLFQGAYARWIFPGLLRALMALLPRQRDLFRDLLNEQMDSGEMARLAWVEDAVAEARRGGAPILIGPWTGGVGHEILYWIPMLRWLRKYYNIDKSRIVVISRGGTKNWYTGVLGHYFDMFDLAPLKREEYRDEALRRITSSETPAAAGKIEKEIYKEAAKLIGAERFNTFHPQIMFKLFKRRWTGLAGDTFVDRYTRLQSIGTDIAAAEKRLGALPEHYVAVAFHFSRALPDTPANRAAIVRFVTALAESVELFLIEPAIDPELGPLAAVGPHQRIHRINREIRASEILAVQAGVIAGSAGLVGTLGPMSYLGQALHRPTVGVMAADGELSPGERELGLVRPDPDAGPIHAVRLEALDALIPALAQPRVEDREIEGVLAAGALAPAVAAGPAKARQRAPANG